MLSPTQMTVKRRQWAVNAAPMFRFADLQRESNQQSKQRQCLPSFTPLLPAPSLTRAQTLPEVTWQRHGNVNLSTSSRQPWHRWATNSGALFVLGATPISTQVHSVPIICWTNLLSRDPSEWPPPLVPHGSPICIIKVIIAHNCSGRICQCNCQVSEMHLRPELNEFIFGTRSAFS